MVFATIRASKTWCGAAACRRRNDCFKGQSDRGSGRQQFMSGGLGPKAGATMCFAMPREIIERRSSALIVTALLASCVMAGQQRDDPKDVFERGQRSLAAGKYADAERDFDHLLRAGLRSAPVYTNLGVVYLRTGRLD